MKMSFQNINSINNMNIITFIKDIYQSLKNLENKYQSLEVELGKIYQLINEKQIINEHKTNQLIECVSNLNIQLDNSKKNNLNNELEKQLLEQMEQLNKGIMSNTSSKLDLKLSEMTIANLIENNYTTNDIIKNIKNNDSLDFENENISQIKDLDIIKNNPNLINIENLLF